jgi:hypothetical protein
VTSDGPEVSHSLPVLPVPNVPLNVQQAAEMQEESKT